MVGNRLRAPLVALVALLGFSAAQAADPYPINVMLPLTGSGAFLGKAEQQALQRLEILVNATGGIHARPLQFVFHDDQTNPQTGIQLVNQLLAAKPAVILGPSLVAVCNAVAPLMKNGPVDYCLSPGIKPAPGGYVFSTSTGTDSLGSTLLHYFGKRGWKRVALITSTDASGQDAYRNIKGMVGKPGYEDVEIVAEAQFNPTDVSASAQIERLKAAKPDALIAWSTGSPVGTVFKAIQDAGLEVPVGTTNGNMTYAQMTQYASFLPKELFIPSTVWPKGDDAKLAPGVVQAKADFYKSFEGTDIKPDSPSTLAWDPALIVVSALRKLKPEATAEDLRAYLLALQGFDGVNGPYDFKAMPNRGIGEENVVVTRWDPAKGAWVIVSAPQGVPLKP